MPIPETPVQQALSKARADRWNCIGEVFDDRPARPESLPLSGIPFVAKCNFDVKGRATLAGGPPHASLAIASNDAFVIEKLEAAGALLVASTHMDEYALGFTGANPHHGAVINPLDSSRISGGSSSGTAAAIAAGIVPLGLGTDTNGSVRVPAAMCGIFALKPTYGQLRTQGVFPMAPTLDHVGLLASSLDLLERAYRVLVPELPRPGGHDSNLVVFGAGDYEQHCDPGIHSGLMALRDVFDAAPTLQFSHLARCLAAASTITLVEAAAIHARAMKTTPWRYSEGLRDRLNAAAGISAAQYSDALNQRRLIRAEMDRLFKSMRVLVIPAVPIARPSRMERTVSIRGREWTLSDALGLFSRLASLTGFPALVVPLEKSDAAVQLIAAPGDEAALFAAARRIG